MPKAEGLSLDFESPKVINAKILETFPYKGPRQKVLYETEEFSAVCPFSGLPDFGKLLIEYYPDKKIVELKSLKYYLLSYRNVGIYQEHANARLFEDLKKLLSPQEITVSLIYQTRGGIDTTTSVTSKDQ